MTNRTGKDQPFMYSGPMSNIYISRNDTIISMQYDGPFLPEAIIPGVLKKDSALTNHWLAPLSLKHPMPALIPGIYKADVYINVHFDDVAIQNPQCIQINIIDTIEVRVMKPNIYLYPKINSNLSIALEFPLGGSVIQSAPLYSNGWNVSVDTSGKIDNLYDYLFYESENPDVFQHKESWIVKRDTLSSFFSNNLLQIGFSEREKNDFIEYWIPRLTDYPYYIIYPQFANDINKVIRLKFSKSPDNILRLFYLIKGIKNANQTILVPIIPPFKRTGFVVTEWGVILK